MCTVTYIPLDDNSFILTHNRDESVKRRIASPPLSHMIEGRLHLFPVDPQGMGTWIGVSESGRVASLLNGGRKKQRTVPPYRHSRGRIILDYFKYPSFIEFFNDYDFNGLEPFTLLVFEGGHVFETILDKDQVQFRKINAIKPLIFASSTLYPPESITRKRDLFMEWFSTRQLNNKEGILNFHKLNVFENEPEKVKTVGDHILKTVSITSILSSRGKVRVDYFDLLNDIRFWKDLVLREEPVPVP